MADMLPLTVAVPVYKRAHAILPLLRALAAQAKPGDDLVVIDDASGDSIEKVVSEIPSFRLICHPTNLGMVGNWNACLQQAKHDWVCIVHHDDEVAPVALNTLRRACTLAGGPALVVHWRQEAKIDDHFRCRWCEAGPWAVLNVPTIPSGAVIHRQVIKDVGTFDPRWKYSADLEYFARICAHFPLIIVESPDVVHYCLHETNYQYATWQKADFEDQYREMQELILSYTKLPRSTSSKLLKERMAYMYLHIFLNAGRIGDRRLLRHSGKKLISEKIVGRRRRVQAAIATLLGWYPMMHLNHFVDGNAKILNS